MSFVVVLSLTGGADNPMSVFLAVGR